jgi:hypothetical protein
MVLSDKEEMQLAAGKDMKMYRKYTRDIIRLYVFHR